MSSFWNAWVWALTVITVVGCLWLLQAMTTRRVDGAQGVDTTGHSWDGDLEEFNNPLPRWWLYLFWITAIFLVVYLVIYPGLGNFAGITGWTQKGEYEAEVRAAEQRYGNVYAAFAGMPIAEMAKNPDAVRLGRNLFLNRCATCHGSDARGARGFPNLTDRAWLYGGAPETIEQTITNGRMGVMPALGAVLGDQGVDEVIAYLRALPGLTPPTASPAAAYTSEPGAAPAATAAAPATPALDAKAAAGQQKFMTFCIGCHGADARGNPALGAPNLTDGDWLHGPTDADIRDVIMKGRVNQMPAQKDSLNADRIRVLAGYVLSLGENGGG